MKRHIACLMAAFVLASLHVGAQDLSAERGHVDWRFSSLKQSGSEWKLVFTAVIDRGWHMYSQSTPEGGPAPVSFSFDEDAGYRLSGKLKELGMIKKGYDDVFMTDVYWYEGSAIFSQVVKVRSKTVVKGKIDYAVCSEEMCVPGTVRFSLDVGN